MITEARLKYYEVMRSRWAKKKAKARLEHTLKVFYDMTLDQYSGKKYRENKKFKNRLNDYFNITSERQKRSNC